MKPTDKVDVSILNIDDYENLVKIHQHDGEPLDCGVSPNDMFWLIKRLAASVLTC